MFLPFGLDANTATNIVMPLAQQAAQTMPSAILPSYKQTAQAISPYLPLAIQPNNDDKGAANGNQPPYDQASQHFKAGALPWVGDSGATQANTGLWYLTQALQTQWNQQQLWNAQQLTAIQNTQKQLMLVQNRLEQNNRLLGNTLSMICLPQQPLSLKSVSGVPANNLNVVA
jgi:hypothetical protein